MNELLIERLIDEIAQQGILSRISLALLGFATVGLILSLRSFIDSYNKERAKLKAQMVDLAAIKTILAAQTDTVESIKHAMEFDTWHRKEQNQLLRGKLEEIAFNCQSFVSSSFSDGLSKANGVPSNNREGSDALARFTSLIGLYFPILNPAALNLIDSSQAYDQVCKAVFFARLKRVRVREHSEPLPKSELDIAIDAVRATREELASVETSRQQFLEAGTKITLEIYEAMERLMPTKLNSKGSESN